MSEVKYSDIAKNDFNLSAKEYNKEPIRVIILCDTVMSGSGEFLNECKRAGATVKKLGGFRYKINESFMVDFKRYDFSSVAGQRADILIGDCAEIEAWRLAVVSHSKHIKWSKDIRTRQDLLDLVIKTADV